MRVEEYAFTFDELHEDVVLLLIRNSIYKKITLAILNILVRYCVKKYLKRGNHVGR